MLIYSINPNSKETKHLRTMAISLKIVPIDKIPYGKGSTLSAKKVSKPKKNLQIV